MKNFRGEANAFLYSVGALYGVRDRGEERSALRNLLSAPEDLPSHSFPASVYDELPRRLLPDRKGRRRARVALPLAYRAQSSFVWRSNPFSLREGAGDPGDFLVSGVDYLCAYWLGRFSGWVPAPNH